MCVCVLMFTFNKRKHDYKTFQLFLFSHLRIILQHYIILAHIHNICCYTCLVNTSDGSKNITESEESKDDNRIQQVAAIACVIDDGMNENSEFEIEDDKELLPLYSVKQKESVNNVVINPDLTG